MKACGFWVLLLLSLLGACRRPIGAPLPPTGLCRSNASQATLGPNDVFVIRVFGEDNLSGEFRVGPDGYFEYPHLNRVDVSRLQASELAELIRRRLGPPSAENPEGMDVLRRPSVNVTVREANSRRISVFGQVQHPGVFPHTQCLTLTQAISLAGGFTALAEKNQVRVTRRDREGRPRTYVLRVEDIAEGRAQDFDLEPGDVVFVAESIT
ncbi:MAG: polysaccharide export protein [Deltaproteobacteria bacterium]|nr:polysaccharide export protein [Deltaproteobacteria bacterium]